MDDVRVWHVQTSSNVRCLVAFGGNAPVGPTTDIQNGYANRYDALALSPEGA